MAYMRGATTFSGHCDELLAHHDRTADDSPADCILHTRDFAKFLSSRSIAVLTDSQGRRYCLYTPSGAGSATRIWDGVGPAGIPTAWDFSGSPRLGSLEGPHR